MNSNTIGSRIKAARKAKKLTQKELAVLALCSATSIVYWERNEIEPKSKNLVALARALDMAPDFLMYGATFGEEVSMAQFHSRVPVIKWASVGLIRMSEEVDWIYCPVQCGKDTFALTVKSDSMVSSNLNNKSYPVGTILFVDPSVEVKNGSMCVAKKTKTKEATFKQFISDGGENYLKPLNNQYPTILVDEKTLIIGCVIGSFQPE